MAHNNKTPPTTPPAMGPAFDCLFLLLSLAVGVDDGPARDMELEDDSVLDAVDVGIAVESGDPPSAVHLLNDDPTETCKGRTVNILRPHWIKTTIFLNIYVIPHISIHI